jgi:hypothetical protein
VVDSGGKRPPGKDRSRWEDNIKMSLRHEESCGNYSSYMLTAGISCGHGNEISDSIKCKFLNSFYRRAYLHGVSNRFKSSVYRESWLSRESSRIIFRSARFES